MPPQAERKNAAHATPSRTEERRACCAGQNRGLLRTPGRARQNGTPMPLWVERNTAAHTGPHQTERNTAAYAAPGGTGDRRACRPGRNGRTSHMPRRAEWKNAARVAPGRTEDRRAHWAAPDRTEHLCRAGQNGTPPCIPGRARQNGIPPRMPHRAERETAAHATPGGAEECRACRAEQNGSTLRVPRQAERRTATHTGLHQTERNTYAAPG